MIGYLGGFWLLKILPIHPMTADFTQSEPQEQTTLEGQPVANMVSIEVKEIMTTGLKEIVVCIIYIFF